MTGGRMLGACLAAGLANLVLGFGFAHVVGVERFMAPIRDHGLRVITTPADAAQHVAMRFALGAVTAVLTWALAARCGSGVGAALAAAGFVWALNYAWTAWGRVHIALFPAGLMIGFAAWGIVEAGATAIAAGWVLWGRGFWAFP